MRGPRKSCARLFAANGRRRPPTPGFDSIASSVYRVLTTLCCHRAANELWLRAPVAHYGIGEAMSETPAISDRNLEAATNISLKREPACFAFLSARSVAPPMPIDSINLDLASADYFQNRASLWTTLEIRSSVSNDRPTAILGFDETFLRPFARALVEAATTRAAYRMTILREAPDNQRCRVVEYVTGAGKPLKELVLQPFENLVMISAANPKGEDETLFQL